MPTIEEIIERFRHNAEFERTHGNLQGCLEYRQIAEWLDAYRQTDFRIKKPDTDKDAVDEAYLRDWYINSVNSEDDPVWTEKHIKELSKDFYVIPKKNVREKGNT